MTTRVRYELASQDRAELLPMDGLSVRLRAQITAAMERGDDQAVLDLQRQYRERPLRGRTRVGGSTTTRAAAPVAPNVLRTAASAVMRESGDVTRQVVGYLVTWGPQPTAVGENGDEAVMLDVQPRSLAGWLGHINPAGMGLVADHETASAGNWRSFIANEHGLLSTAEADHTPAGDALLDACDDGRAQGLSFKARIVRSHATGSTMRGLPLVIADEIELQEGGPTPEPSDESAVILLVRGRTPHFMQQQEAMERAEVLRNLRGPGQAPARTWRPSFAR